MARGPGIKGRIAVVTGGDSGKGYATAEMRLREGVRVIPTDLPGAPLAEAEAALRPLGQLVAIEADLTRADRSRLSSGRPGKASGHRTSS